MTLYKSQTINETLLINEQQAVKCSILLENCLTKSQSNDNMFFIVVIKTIC